MNAKKINTTCGKELNWIKRYNPDVGDVMLYSLYKQVKPGQKM